MNFPKLIADAPAGNDELQSHKPIAEAMVHVVETEAGGRTIGLEGEWGSGKSTVVRFFCDKLKGSQVVTAVTFKFDAWAHQADPLRRAFLQALIDECTDEKRNSIYDLPQHIIEKIREQRDKVGQKIKITDKRSTPRPGRIGKAMLISFSLFPLGTSLLIASLSQRVSLTWEGWLGAIGLLLVSMPFLILVTALAVTRKNDDRSDEVWGMFFSKNTMAEKIEITETPEPSSIEFQEIFRSVVACLLHNAKMRLVIVLDNLDRVSDNEANEIWAILRSFIDNPAFENEDWFERLWVVVPYSSQALKPKVAEDTKHFLDKIIQLCFAIPKPVLSNVRDYLGKLLISAFGGKAATAQIIQVITYLVTKEMGATSTPAPRELIHLVNSMVGTVLQWRDIPLDHHAYFAILRRQKTTAQIITFIITGEVGKISYLNLMSPNLDKSLAALSCNVPKEIASQTLFWPLVNNMLLDQQNTSRLREKYREHGIPEILELALGEVLTENAKTMVHFYCANLVVIFRSKILDDMSDLRRRQTVQQILDSLAHLRYWDLASNDALRAILLLIKYDQELFFRTALQAVVKRTIEHIASNTSSLAGPGDGQTIVRGLYVIRANRSVRKYLDEHVNFNLDIGVTPDEWVKFCHFNRIRNRSLAGFSPRVGWDAIFGALQGSPYMNDSPPMINRTIQTAWDHGVAVPRSVYALLLMRICRDSATPATEMLITLPFLDEAAKHDATAGVAIDDLTTDPWLFHYLGLFSPEVTHDISDLHSVQASPNFRVQVCARLVCLLIYSMAAHPLGQLDQGFMPSGKILFDKILNMSSGTASVVELIDKRVARDDKLRLRIGNLLTNSQFKEIPLFLHLGSHFASMENSVADQ